MNLLNNTTGRDGGGAALLFDGAASLTQSCITGNQRVLPFASSSGVFANWGANVQNNWWGASNGPGNIGGGPGDHALGSLSIGIPSTVPFPICGGSPPSTPTPTATPNQQVTIHFSGMGVSITSPGPTPECQTLPWFGISDYSYQYPGTKLSHAQLALGQSELVSSDVFVVGYSAGADSALIFAQQYIQARVNDGQPGKIVGMILLGPTFTGGSVPSMNFLNDLIGESIYIYVFNDVETIFSGGLDSPQLPYYNYVADSIIEHADDSQHYLNCTDNPVLYPPRFGVGTNNDPNVMNSILSWFAQYGMTP